MDWRTGAHEEIKLYPEMSGVHLVFIPLSISAAGHELQCYVPELLHLCPAQRH